MGKKMCPKVILEGTRLTWKTEIAFALNEHPRVVGVRKYRYHSPVVSGEWCGFTNTPWGRGLINFNPDEEGRALETYRTWVRMFELQRYYSWIVDRFHLSTVAFQEREHGKVYDFAWLEERLNRLGFVLIFCNRSVDSFEKARKRRLKISGNPKQYDDLSFFAKEQAQMERLVTASTLPTLRLDVSHDDVGRAADTVADWLEAGGYLYAPASAAAVD